MEENDYFSIFLTQKAEDRWICLGHGSPVTEYMIFQWLGEYLRTELTRMEPNRRKYDRLKTITSDEYETREKSTDLERRERNQK